MRTNAEKVPALKLIELYEKVGIRRATKLIACSDATVYDAKKTGRVSEVYENSARGALLALALESATDGNKVDASFEDRKAEAMKQFEASGNQLKIPMPAPMPREAQAADPQEDKTWLVSAPPDRAEKVEAILRLTRVEFVEV